ncbi:LADA_0D06062g1_1 [Lachancea dasiensis]|uniref:non-specific serine/threonine protein kinase n=1 Tax=Lachancea dasiensis TaxID=1072105 RepID=A0A1G4J5T5_9SACH|nr:LADA_0D06062g1_1 [Lachancea dasiensis]
MLTNCEINNFKLTRQIGSGAYGLVFHAVDLITENEYAIKAVVKDGSSNGTGGSDTAGPESDIKRSTMLQTQLYYYFKSFQNQIFLPTVDLDSIFALDSSQLKRAPHFREIVMHLRVHAHANVVTIHQVLESPLATFLVLDYCPRDLFTSIVDHQHFAKDPLLVKRVFLQLCSVLQHCHARGIYHCDIKPENILLDDHDNVYVCDFGLSTESPQLPANVCLGSSYYMAPERLSCPTSLKSSGPSGSTTDECSSQRSSSSTPSPPLFPTWAGDVWSVGIILINLTCIRNPWLKANQSEDSTFSYFVKDPQVLLKILPVSQQLYQILKDILRLDPATRASLDSIMDRVAHCTSFTTFGPLSEVASLDEIDQERFLSNPRALRIKQMLQNYHSDEEPAHFGPQMENDSEVTSEEEGYCQLFNGQFASTGIIGDKPLNFRKNQQQLQERGVPFELGINKLNLTKNASVMTNYSCHTGWPPQYR